MPPNATNIQYDENGKVYTFTGGGGNMPGKERTQSGKYLATGKDVVSMFMSNADMCLKRYNDAIEDKTFTHNDIKFKEQSAQLTQHIGDLQTQLGNFFG